jgi:hypothetical protein
MEKFNELKRLLDRLEEDATKFYDRDTKVAGVRLRKGLQEIKSLAQEIRKEITSKNKK